MANSEAKSNAAATFAPVPALAAPPAAAAAAPTSPSASATTGYNSKTKWDGVSVSLSKPQCRSKVSFKKVHGLCNSLIFQKYHHKAKCPCSVQKHGTRFVVDIRNYKCRHLLMSSYLNIQQPSKKRHNKPRDGLFMIQQSIIRKKIECLTYTRSVRGQTKTNCKTENISQLHKRQKRNSASDHHPKDVFNGHNSNNGVSGHEKTTDSVVPPLGIYSGSISLSSIVAPWDPPLGAPMTTIIASSLDTTPSAGGTTSASKLSAGTKIVSSPITVMTSTFLVPAPAATTTSGLTISTNPQPTTSNVLTISTEVATTSDLLPATFNAAAKRATPTSAASPQTQTLPSLAPPTSAQLNSNLFVFPNLFFSLSDTASAPNPALSAVSEDMSTVDLTNPAVSAVSKDMSTVDLTNPALSTVSEDMSTVGLTNPTLSTVSDDMSTVDLTNPALSTVSEDMSTVGLTNPTLSTVSDDMSTVDLTNPSLSTVSDDMSTVYLTDAALSAVSDDMSTVYITDAALSAVSDDMSTVGLINPTLSTVSDDMSTIGLANPALSAEDMSAVGLTNSSNPQPLSNFSTATLEFFENQLQCHGVSPVTCLIDAVNAPQGIMADEVRERLLVTSSNMLMDDLSTFMQAVPQIDHRVILSDYLSVMDALLQLCTKHGAHLGQEKMDAVLVKAESFLHSMMITARTSDFHQDLQLTLSHLELLVTRSEYRKIKHKRLHFKSGSITIDDIYWKEAVSERANTLVSALLMDVPKAEIRLAQGETTVSAVLVSPVLSLSAVVAQVKVTLSHTFALTVNSIPNGTSDQWPVCAYQSVDVWDLHGCEAVAVSTSSLSFSNGGDDTFTNKSDPGTKFVECHCNHTSNFAILMQIVSFPLSPKDEVALSIITYIGCTVSLITQAMAITVFTCIRSLNSERVCVHRNLCISIMAAQITFIAGIKAVENKVLCAFVAVILHYLYTASFVWMLVEGLHLYSKVVRVFGTEKSRILYYLCFGWGVPLLLVAISTAVDWGGFGTPNSCWLSVERSTIWAFVGPAVAIMIVNFVILVAVLRIVVTAAKLDKHEDTDTIKAGVKATILLLPLLGLTWMFGLVAVNEDLLVFQYIFALLNSLQGFFIFLCHCVFNSEVRQTLKRMKEKRSLQKGNFATTLSVTNSRPSSSGGQASNETDGLTTQTRLYHWFRKGNQVAPSPSLPGSSNKEANGLALKNQKDLTAVYI